MAGDGADMKPVSQILNLALQKLFWIVLNEAINLSVLLLPPGPMENKGSTWDDARGFRGLINSFLLGISNIHKMSQEHKVFLTLLRKPSLVSTNH